LGVHIQRAHRDHEAGRAVLNATSCKALRCPLWRCGKHVSAKKLLHHVASHAKEDVEAVKPNLELLGLVLHLSPGHDATIQVMCPVCHTVSTNIEEFTGHLTTSHLCTQSGGSEHFEEWKAYLCRDWQTYSGASMTTKVLPWSSLDRINIVAGLRVIMCPSCPFSVAGGRGYGYDHEDKERAIKEHHLSLLRPEAEVVRELYPYRIQILRLWPEFVTHPVFADIDRPQQQSESGALEAQSSIPSHTNDDHEIVDQTAHEFVPHSVSADFDRPQQQRESGPSHTQPSFLGHINNDFEIPDWTIYDFNTSM
jgi:hypothetical protein